ncbi:long-chain fatty acid--CoA ligase [Brevibacterium ravenspurgense]|uniref:acyl-CoA synthetase n=1 Tax=Brevibacterium ravenspurgense TaxID=479117 RepID=UPI001EF18BF0|nr:long-chain fatty acid--CoA ligase [Brevibacterium ravenspurgense]MCG7301367.1 long-chain fatty acid--CoA ligase [Brevibacterium ravenspurgense]
MKVSIGSWVTRNAGRQPDAVALIDAETGESWTYRDLDERTDRLASALSASGVGKGDRVALVTLNSTAMMEIFIAVSKLEAASVAINFRLTAGEIRFILEDSGTVFCFASDVFIPTVAQASEGLDLRQVVTVPSKMSGRPREESTYDDFLASGGAFAHCAAPGWDDLALLMYTSGTTGKPKGAMLTNGNMFTNSIHAAEGQLGATANDINLSVAPLFHIGALGISTLPLLYWAGCNVIAEGFDPSAWSEYVEKYQVTKAFMVPTMWHTVVTSGVLGKHDLSTLNIGMSGGAPCPVALLQALADSGIPMAEGFGMTETSPIVCLTDPNAFETRPGSVGKPLMHVETRIVDSSGGEVPAGEVGELALRGPSIIDGYWNRPDANEASYRDGWFLSGDLAKQDEDGFLYIVDRKKDMLITGGENVYPAEVENVLYRHDAINEVAVIGTYDEKWGEAVTAFIVVASGTQADEQLAEDIREFSRASLAGFKVPRRIRFVNELPKTATGKIRKTELKDDMLEG